MTEVKRLLLTGGSGFIGSHLADIALDAGMELLSLDLVAPKLPHQITFWRQLDIRDLESLKRAFAEFAPDYVVHLASDIDVSVEDISAFTTTVNGTRNVIEAVKVTPGILRFIHVSSQYTVTPGVSPRDEHDLQPYTVYGEAKAETERMVWASGLTVPWFIMRPTIIWGPRHPSFGNLIWKYIAERKYLHPQGAEPIRRTYGYVQNTADQMFRFLQVDHKSTNRRVFYLGDATINYDDWADRFSIALTGKKARRVPIWFLKLIAVFGDTIGKIGFRFPFNRGRLFRMTTSAPVDLDTTFAAIGRPNISIDDGVRESVAWLRQYDEATFRR